MHSMPSATAARLRDNRRQRRQDGGGARDPHRRQRGLALWMRLREVMRVGGRAVAGDFAKNDRAAPSRVVKIFQREHRRTFTQRESVAVRVERTTPRRRQGLKRIETREDQLTERVVTARQHPLGVAVANQIEGVTDGVRTRRAGVGDESKRPAKAKCRRKIDPLLLHLILRDARRLPSLARWFADGLAVIGFPGVHATTRRAEDDRQVIGRFPACLRPGLVRRQ